MAAIKFTTFDRAVNGHEPAYGAALAAKITAAVLDLDGRDSAARCTCSRGTFAVRSGRCATSNFQSLTAWHREE